MRMTWFPMGRARLAAMEHDLGIMPRFVVRPTSWCGVVCDGVGWRGVGWRGVVRCVMVWAGVAWRGVGWFLGAVGGFGDHGMLGCAAALGAAGSAGLCYAVGWLLLSQQVKLSSGVQWVAVASLRRGWRQSIT